MNARWEHPQDTSALAAVFRAGCELDVLAIKPGNVSIDSPGHGMSARDFQLSGEIAAPHVVDRSCLLGERIYRAIEATRQAVGCNTNLGIVLLAAPLIHAAQECQPGDAFPGRLENSLNSFDLTQTAWVYRAIRLAAPGGLGRSEHHDVQDAPTVTLAVAMQAAAPRDFIARQYANGYHEVLGWGRRALAEARLRWGADARAMTALFLAFLAEYPDSHILRKHGDATAAYVQELARQCLLDLDRSAVWEDGRHALDVLDGTLKSAGINPGTSADLCVATWLADRLMRDLKIRCPSSHEHERSRAMRSL